MSQYVQIFLLEIYFQVIYALCVIGNMCKGEKLLIHAGSGGVGLAAITLAYTYGCTVFTTVGTQEKRDFIKQQFPQVKPTHAFVRIITYCLKS